MTFVNPTPRKGALLFARLADMLGSRRPDIPILVVQSAAGAGGLNAIHGLDFGRYPHIMAAPATPRPADFFGLTRILLVPSVFREPFGRVAAEALINGIPPLVSDRGALPETVRRCRPRAPVAGVDDRDHDTAADGRRSESLVRVDLRVVGRSGGVPSRIRNRPRGGRPALQRVRHAPTLYGVFRLD